MKIALDYDDTFTLDKDMWGLFVELILASGYEVRFVTARFEEARNYSNGDIKVDASKLNIPIIFCNGVQKHQRCIDVGYDVDVWIDDFPVLIPTRNELECILRGVKVNDDKQRTILSNKEEDDDSPIVVRRCTI